MKNQKKLWLILLVTVNLFLITNQSFGQAGIKVDEANINRTPDASAIFDASATTKGILIPQLSLSATNVSAPVITPANSLLVFNTASAGTGSTVVTPGYYYWDTLNNEWIRLLDPTDSVVTIDSAEWVDGNQVGLATGNIYARKALARGDTIVIDTNGFVGFGLNNPRHAFHMIQNDGNARLVIERTDNLSGGTLVLEQSGANVTNGLSTGTIDSYSQVAGARAWTSRIGFYNGAANTRAGNIGFYTSEGSGNPTERMTVTDSGFVGIGNTNPSSLLDVGPGCCLGTNIEINGYSYYGGGFSGGATVLGHNVMSDTSMSVTNNMIVANNSATIGYSAIRVGGSEGDPDSTGYGSISFYGFDGATTAGVSVLNPNVIIKGNTGNVGIGTTIPAAKLHINTNNINPVVLQNSQYVKENTALQSFIEFRDSIGDVYAYVGEGSSGKKIGLVGHHNYSVVLASYASNTAGSERSTVGINENGEAEITFDTKTVERVRIDSNGNVGIGTQTPAQKLTVQNGPIGMVRTDGAANSIYIGNSSGRDWQIYHLGSADANSPNGYMLEHFDGAAWRRYFTINQSGNVGIGTGAANPTAKLQIDNRFSFDAGGFMDWGQASDYGRLSWDGPNNEAEIYSLAGRHLAFGTNGSAGNQLFLHTNTNVGIGTSNPRYKLHAEGGFIGSEINSVTGILGGLFVDGRNSAAAEPNFRSWAIYNMVEYSGTQNGLVFWEYYDRNNNGITCDDGPTDCTSRMIIQNGTGNLGVGFDNPTEKLDVAGNIRASGNFISGATTLTVPDYVFETYYKGTSSLKNDYNFKTLEEIESFTKAKGHLPGIPSAKEIQEKGQLNLTQSSLNNLEKIEELYLHLIEVNKENKELKEKLILLEERLSKLEKNK